MADESEKIKRKKRWRSFAVDILLIIIVVTAIRAWQHRDFVSGPAPALQGVTLAGKPFNLLAHPEQPVLVHFWASWCSICRAEQGSIAGIAKNNPNVITIAMQSGKSEDVTKHMQEQAIDFPVLNDQDGSISRSWGVHAVPTSFIVAPNGRIQFIEVGYTTEIGLTLRLWLAGLRTGSAS